MKFQLYQIVIPAFSLLMLFYAISKFRRKSKSMRELFIWAFFWGAISFVAIYPEVTNIVARITGIQNNVNAVVFVAFILLFFIVFKLLIIIEEMEQRITSIVREESLRELRSKK